MPRITNPNYRQFIDKGVINLITTDEFEQALSNVNGINGKHIREARALLITLYYTGARPVEVLSLKAENIYKEGSFIKIDTPTFKKGVPRIISLSGHLKHVKELYDYSQRNFPGRYLFYNFRSDKIKIYYTKKGEAREYNHTTDKLRYHIGKWFMGVRKDTLTPYFLRHNRFSKMAEAGATPMDIQFIKGSRDLDSVNMYLHMSREKSEKLARKIR